MTAAMSSLVDLERRGAAAVLTLQRPEKLNAFTLAMLAEIAAAVEEAMGDPDVVGLVITGAGRGFSAGLDVSALTETTEAGAGGRAEPAEGELPGLFSYLLEQPKPVIAAVNGVAAGGGFVLAAKCDLRLASADASFITAFSQRGLIAEHGLTWLLPRLIGTGAALDLLWSSRRVEAEEAHRLGLVQRVVEPGQLLDAAVDYVDQLAASAAPTSMRDTKRLLYRHLGSERDAAFAEADELTWEAVGRPDAAEGAAALVERRAPRFRRLGGDDA